MSDKTPQLEAFRRLLTIMDELREQCPWDRKQTLLSLRKLTIEETYELADELLKEDLEGIKEEVGDLLLHMVFYAKIASEQGAWDIADALHSVCDKLVERHPHIYGNVVAEDEEAVKQNWEKIKLAKGQGKKTVLSGVPTALPAMVKAMRMQEKTAQFGFDWDNVDQVWEKVREEMEEFRTATDERHREEEFGDLLFSLINYARWKGIDPELALERTNRKFRERFEYVENAAGAAGLAGMPLAEMEALWQASKKLA
ncbi:nucleoside triphosphate pyrophosphohydrolase [Neolewinella lacunae]|uniref:Nucleoside triphosphate pyrophosphohydrolase n=1 Tax=Neolewinella lacunae TaxID=1517758 RepID=A0A923PII5_9BACT|nr:nucleoside triphosphate pyrophosphohydrolase [Neolewinella lacunae]MBC6994712.1 nucleoside triphosphate pyrophosphohydrolase [Neolewinella lacunae]MDN3634584.1 nucleoside triphosphate pyrophosphohydrolase [Neolewinella lacunae]